MLLYDVSSITADELQKLFLAESKKFASSIDKLPYNDVQGIRQNLKAIVEELQKRTKGKPAL